MRVIGEAQRDGPSPERGVARVAADLRRLARAEPRAILGALLADAGARSLAKRAVASQQQLARLVSDLGCSTHDDVELALATYRAAFLEHVRFMEEEIFPAARLALGDERCVRLAEVYDRAAAEAEALAP